MQGAACVCFNKKCCVRAFATIHKHPHARFSNQRFADSSSLVASALRLDCRIAPVELFPCAETTRIPSGQGGDAARRNVLPVCCCVSCAAGWRLPRHSSACRELRSVSRRRKKEKEKENKPVRNAGKPIHPAVPRPHSNREASCAEFLFVDAAVLIVWITCKRRRSGRATRPRRKV